MSDPVQGVVFQISSGDPRVLAGATRNLDNLLAAVGPNTTIEVVAHGEGIIALLSDGPVADEMAALGGKGIHLSACKNTMERKSISPDSLVADAHTVPSGVAEIVEKQWAGWAYVRP